MSVFVSGAITYKKQLSCINCTKPFYSRHRMDLISVDAAEVAKHIKHHFRLQMPDIPVDWRIDGRDTIYCPECRPDRNG